MKYILKIKDEQEKEYRIHKIDGKNYVGYNKPTDKFIVTLKNNTVDDIQFSLLINDIDIISGNKESKNYSDRSCFLALRGQKIALQSKYFRDFVFKNRKLNLFIYKKGYSKSFDNVTKALVVGDNGLLVEVAGLVAPVFTFEFNIEFIPWEELKNKLTQFVEYEKQKI